MNLEGNWQGESVYDDGCQTASTLKPIAFSMTVSIYLLSGLFEGICKEPPLVKDQELISSIYGKLRVKEIFFTKRYPLRLDLIKVGNSFLGKNLIRKFISLEAIMTKAILWHVENGAHVSKD